MSRNRYRHTHSMQWATVLKWFVIVGTMAALGMSYVLMKNQILRLASEVRDYESELSNWKKRNGQLGLNINKLTSHVMLQRRVNELGLGLVKIGELDVVAMDHGKQGARSNPFPVAYAGPAKETR
jgi:hypothetical protein